MATKSFTFDELNHVYRDDGGLVLPSVTQVLQANGFIDFSRVPPAVLERKRKIGTLVHKLTELYDQGEGFENFDIPDAVMPYCEGWANFRWDSGFEPTSTEDRMIGEIHGMCYGMTLDVDGTLDGEYYILEKKCGSSESPVWGLQTAAYDLGKNNRPTAKRAAVQLGPQFPRGYKLFVYPEATDYQIWQSALANTIWRMNKGLFAFELVPEREAA